MIGLSTARPLVSSSWSAPVNDTLGWLLVAAAVLLWAAPSTALERTSRLSAAARLAAERRDAARAGPRWADVVRFAPAVGALVSAVVLVLAGPAAAIAFTAVAGLAAVLARDHAAGRRSRADEAALRAGIDMIVGELEAGAQPAGALLAAAGSAGRHGAVLQRASAAAAAGGDPAAVLLADHRTCAMGVAWQVGHDGGTALATVLRRVSADLRAMAEQRRAVQVALSGPRSSAVLLAGLPLLGIGLGLAMGAQPFGFLTSSSAGRLVGCVGVLLDVGGVVWMRRILRRASGP